MMKILKHIKNTNDLKEGIWLKDSDTFYVGKKIITSSDILVRFDDRKGYFYDSVVSDCNFNEISNNFMFFCWGNVLFKNCNFNGFTRVYLLDSSKREILMHFCGSVSDKTSVRFEDCNFPDRLEISLPGVGNLLFMSNCSAKAIRLKDSLICQKDKFYLVSNKMNAFVLESSYLSKHSVFDDSNSFREFDAYNMSFDRNNINMLYGVLNNKSCRFKNFSYMSIHDANFKEINFGEGILERIDFFDSSIDGCNFSDCLIKKCSFHNTDISNAKFPNGIDIKRDSYGGDNIYVVNNQ